MTETGTVFSAESHYFKVPTQYKGCFVLRRSCDTPVIKPQVIVSLITDVVHFLEAYFHDGYKYISLSASKYISGTGCITSSNSPSCHSVILS